MLENINAVNRSVPVKPHAEMPAKSAHGFTGADVGKG
jgi:hypothetical protein